MEEQEGYTHYYFNDGSLDEREAQIIPLSPDGISPWSHRVQLTPEGELCLYWQENGQQRIRCFTHAETCRLAEFLYDRKQALFFPQQEE